jgi:dipeptidyl aminopeptidase/acylaminoacyl peptidase
MIKPVPVTFESKGANIHAIFYQASGVEPLPTVILCHGFPGNNTDVLGLGQRLMKEGFNALAFNYRGTWGSEGTFTNANSVEDVIAAVHYVKSTVAVREFNVDPSNVALAGYSLGGGMALLGSLSDPAIRRLADIAGGNLGEAARMIQQSAELKRALEENMDQDISVSGFKAPRAKEFSAEILADADKYDLVKHAQALSCKNILIIGGWRDQEADIEHHILPLFRALQRHGAKQVQIEIFDTDHSFTNVRSQLADRIVSWLKRTPSADTMATQ